MTNALQIATVVIVSYVTNIIERPPENGPQGNTRYRTNVISAVIELTPPGLPTVTNTVPVSTNVMLVPLFPPPARFRSTVHRPYPTADTLPPEKRSPAPGKALTPSEAKALGLPTVQKK